MPEDVNLLPLVKILFSPKAQVKWRLVRVVEGVPMKSGESVYTGNDIDREVPEWLKGVAWKAAIR